VHENARVTGNARVYGLAEVTGSASCINININNERIYERADCRGDEIKIEPVVTDDARVYGNAKVSGSARIVGNAKVFGDAEVTGTALIFGDMEIDSDVYDGTQEYRRIAEEIFNNVYAELHSQLKEDCPKEISEDDLTNLTMSLLKGTKSGSVEEAINSGCERNKFINAAGRALLPSAWEFFAELALPLVKASNLKRLEQVADLLELAKLAHDAREVGKLADTVETLDETLEKLDETLEKWGISEAELESYNNKVREEYERLLEAGG